MTSTNWSQQSVNSTNWGSTSVNSTNYTPQTINSSNWESDDPSAGAILLQNGDNILTETAGNLLLQ